MEERGTRRDMPMKPQVVALGARQGGCDDAIVCCDSGTIATWFARHDPRKRADALALRQRSPAWRNGLPYAIAAQIAYPDRQVVAFVGDGGFSMLMASSPRREVPAAHQGGHRQEQHASGRSRWEQMVFLGNPSTAAICSRSTSPPFARACGGTGFTVEGSAPSAAPCCGGARHAGPVVVEAVVDPNAPPLPAKITAEQALRFAEALAKGEPGGFKIMQKIFKDKVRELV
jgi:pyruvate dehydrogenase (quinone)/pyruvate oxidase